MFIKRLKYLQFIANLIKMANIKLFFSVFLALVILSSFASAFTDYGLDIDNNSLYDYLIIETTIDIPEAGEYEIKAELDFDFGNDIQMMGDDDFYFEEGENIIQLQFNGREIYAKSIDGEYNLNLGIEGEDNDFEYGGNNIYTTTWYNYEDFEISRANIIEITDYGTDSDNDNLFDSLTLELIINVLEEDTYEIHWYTLFEEGLLSYDQEFYLEEGLQAIQLNFEGGFIFLEGYEGSYSTEITLEDTNYDFAYSRSYETSEYNYEDFSTLEFRDYAVDEDGNGLYDYLIIEFDLNSKKEDGYEVFGRLRDSEEENICKNIENEIEISEGENVIQLKFSGTQIFLKEVNGNFELNDLEIEGNNFDYYRSYFSSRPLYITSEYNYEDFEGPGATFTGGFSDHAVDEDGNGLYDYLVIEAEINVTKEGEYEIEGALSNQLGEEIEDNVEFEGYLEEGVQIIPLSFNGIGIYMNGEDNLYVFNELYLRDTYNFEIDFWEEDYFTSNYNYENFEKPGLEVIGEFTDYGVDLNGNDLFEYFTIKIPVNITKAGEYEIEAELEIDRRDFDIEEEFYLEVYDEFIYLNFDGIDIYEGGKNGPYELIDFEINQDGFEIYEINEEYETFEYSYENFEHGDIAPPVIEIISPVENYIKRTDDSEYTMDFRFKVADESKISYCELIINNEVEAIKSNVEKNVEISFSKELSRDSYDWKIVCVDSEGNEASSELRDLIIKKKSSSSSKNKIVFGEPYSSYESIKNENLNVLIESKVISLKSKQPQKRERFIESFFDWLRGLFT